MQNDFTFSYAVLSIYFVYCSCFLIDRFQFESFRTRKIKKNLKKKMYVCSFPLNFYNTFLGVLSLSQNGIRV